MRPGEICGLHGSVIVNGNCIRDYKMESSDEGFYTTTYHRRTHVFCSCWGLLNTVKSSKKSWIAVQSQEHIFIMPDDVPLEESVKLFSCSTKEPQAIVSFILDTNEFYNGSGIAASSAECKEMKTIGFLQERFNKCPDLNYEEAMQIAIEAFCLFSGDIKANELKPFVHARNTLPSKEIDFQGANYESKRKETKYEGIRVGYNRETQIWCGGWDSKLHSAEFAGFNWIAVQGKDSVCVVTQDEVGKRLLKDLSYHIEVYPLFAGIGDDALLKRSFMMSPFAVVSVEVSLNKVDAESRSEASIAEIEAFNFLAKQIKNGPDFTFVVTVQTAIDALIRLAQKDMNKKDTQVCVLRKGKSPVKEAIPYNEIARVNEIVKDLQRRMKPRKHKHRY